MSKRTVTAPTRIEQLRVLQEEFNRQLPDLIRSHAGKVVLFRSGQPIEYFDTVDEAYASGLSRFGLDETFLVALVEAPKDETASIAWYAGVTFA